MMKILKHIISFFLISIFSLKLKKNITAKQKIKKFNLDPTQKAKAKIASSKCFFEKKYAPIAKNKKAQEQSIGSKLSKNKIGLDKHKITNKLNLFISTFLLNAKYIKIMPIK